MSEQLYFRERVYNTTITRRRSSKSTIHKKAPRELLDDEELDVSGLVVDVDATVVDVVVDVVLVVVLVVATFFVVFFTATVVGTTGTMVVLVVLVVVITVTLTEATGVATENVRTKGTPMPAAFFAVT